LGFESGIINYIFKLKSRMMKRLLKVYLLVVVLVATGFGTSYGGFRMKPKQVATELTTISTATAPMAGTAEHKKVFAERRLPRLFSAYKSMVFPHAAPAAGGPREKQGWPGIVSLACGVVGLVSTLAWVPLGIAAIVFGIIGLNRRKYKFTGMALAGLILGGLEILLFILLVAIIAALVL
jgi:hypothetical protein